jgi:hypothetical protein
MVPQDAGKRPMYYAIVACLMFIFPVASIAIDASAQASPHSVASIVPVIAKWSVFWMVGVRLLIAGLRQIVQPAFTAKTILGIQGDDALLLVRELGFGNTAFGVLGIATLLVPGWTLAGALAGGLFYGLAGINHAVQPHRNALENTAMASDLFAAVALLGCCASTL